MPWYDDPRIHQGSLIRSAESNRTIQRAINHSDRPLTGDRTPGWKGVPDEMSRRQAVTKLTREDDEKVAAEVRRAAEVRWTLSIPQEVAAEMNELWMLGESMTDIADAYGFPQSSARTAVRLYRTISALPTIEEKQP